MEIEKIAPEIWTKILHSSSNPAFEFLALQLLLFRLKVRVRKDPSAVDLSIEELKTFFINNKRIPVALRDLEKLINMTRN